MKSGCNPGRIVILNGAPRSGKSSIAEAIQETFDGPWMNLGVDAYMERVMPRRCLPGIGLRPAVNYLKSKRSYLSSTLPSTSPLPRIAGWV